MFRGTLCPSAERDRSPVLSPPENMKLMSGLISSTPRRRNASSFASVAIVAAILSLICGGLLWANPSAQPGVVVSWGSQSIPLSFYDGQRILKVAGGGSYSLALKSDGSVVVWGNNISAGPAGHSNVVQIAAGDSHCLALKSDGSVVAWGSNTYGMSTVPAGLEPVIQIAAGSRHSLALKSDRSVVAWGDNSNGQSTVPAGLGPRVRLRSAWEVQL